MEGIGFDVINLLQLFGQVVNALGTGRGSPQQKYKQAKEASTSLQQALNDLKAGPQADPNLSRLYDQLLRNEQQIQEVLREYDAALSHRSKFHSFRGIWLKLKFEFSDAAKLLDEINRAQPLVYAAVLQGQGQSLGQLSTVCDRLDQQHTSTVSLQTQVQEGFTRSETGLKDALRDLSGQVGGSSGLVAAELRRQLALATMNRRRLESRFDTTEALIRTTLTPMSTEMTRLSNEIKRFIFQNGRPGTGAALVAEFYAAGLSPPRGMSGLGRSTLTRSIADSSSFELLAALVWRVLILFSYLIVLPAEVARIVDNRIEIETAHGKVVRVPWEYWHSPETLHGFFLWHFRDSSGCEYVRAESYTLLRGGSQGTVVDFTCWAEEVKRKSKLTQVFLVGGSRETCPRCASTLRSQGGGTLREWYVTSPTVPN